jgi:hypothetical protein
MDAETRLPTKSYCSECLQETKHDVIASRQRHWLSTDEHGVPHGEEVMLYEFLECRGCESISLRQTYSASFMEEVEVDHFPPSISRRRPAWLSGMTLFAFGGPKKEIRELLNEVYSSLFSGNNRVALMGARAIVDIALTDKLGDVGGFKEKLEAAKKLNWITPAHHKVLEAAVEAGSAASHRAYSPDKKQLDVVIDVVEHLLQLLYVLESNAKEIAKHTPARLPKAPAPKAGGTIAQETSPEATDPPSKA